ncbi:MAG: class 1 fructose-bisphosphatase [Candidatus Adiutrix sp.]|jgi:fructose-1,6-bisphosphatase I|nr:class 1 fructose-bisphosphatase [Candidatus Adiutrix sp.]
MDIGVTIFDHILSNQKLNPGATGAFTRLLMAIVVAAKVVQRDVAKAGLVDVLGRAGSINVQGEEVQKLDEIANQALKSLLWSSGEVCTLISEEEADLIEIPRQFKRGNYLVHFDPLDGSSNIDANVSIGTIFSIYRRVTPPEMDAGLQDALQQGMRQVAAGYIIYGSSCMLVYSTGYGVHGFTLDASVGEFLLSHPSIRIPSRGKIYSTNESNYRYWDEGTRNYIDWLKDPEAGHAKPYTSRYIGSLVADFHRNLLYGGIFLYPADLRDPHKPRGKLRLMCEANPMSFICEQAGGLATTGSERVLEIQPTEIHQRVPLIVGSCEDVQTYQDFMARARGRSAG